MTKEEKITLINNFFDQMREYILSNVGEMPENWDGIELRAYIAHKFEQEAALISDKCHRARKRAFKSDLITRPL